MVYCDIDEVKKRMLIESTDDTYNDSLNDAVNEASAIVDMFLMPYTDVPLNAGNEGYPEMIIAITADFAASVFKRRYFPSEVSIKGGAIATASDLTGINEMDASGWFALGIKKLEQYVKSNYILAEDIGSTLHNPDMYLKLYNKGIITGKEARNLMNDATGAVIAIIESHIKTEEIERTLTTSENVTRNDTTTTYPTRRQKSISFISGDSDTQDGYKKDSESNGSA
jgi:hypothetical protein